VLAAAALVATGCAPADAGGDRADSLAAAGKAKASAQGSWLRERIGSAGDEDWYRFDVSNAGHHLVTLGELPADYDLHVFTGSGRAVASSTRDGRAYEDVYAELRAGSYYVRVRGSARSKATYALQFRRLPDTLHVVSRRLKRHGSALDVHAMLLNNTASWREVSSITLIYKNAAGMVVGRAPATLHVRGPIAPRHLMPFGLADAAVPRAASSYSFDVVSTVTASPGSAAVRGVRLGEATDREITGVGRSYNGTATNVTSSTLRGVVVFVVRYDDLGGIHDFTVAPLPPIAAGNAARYRAPMLGSAPNRVLRFAYVNTGP
jgi:hypothetical protein